MYGILNRVVHTRRTTDHDIEKCHLKGCLGRHRDSLCGLQVDKASALERAERCYLTVVLLVAPCREVSTRGYHIDSHVTTYIYIHACSDTIIIVTRVCSASVTLSVQFPTMSFRQVGMMAYKQYITTRLLEMPSHINAPLRHQKLLIMSSARVKKKRMTPKEQEAKQVIKCLRRQLQV